jgi:hypothetical protein
VGKMTLYKRRTWLSFVNGALSAYYAFRRMTITTVSNRKSIILQKELCWTQLPVHQRMNANGSLLPNDLFS